MNELILDVSQMLLQCIHGNANLRIRKKKKVERKGFLTENFPWIPVSSNAVVSNMFQIFAQEKFSIEPPFIKRDKGIDSLVEVAIMEPQFQSLSPPHLLFPLFLPLQLLLRHKCRTPGLYKTWFEKYWLVVKHTCFRIKKS